MRDSETVTYTTQNSNKKCSMYIAVCIYIVYMYTAVCTMYLHVCIMLSNVCRAVPIVVCVAVLVHVYMYKCTYTMYMHGIYYRYTDTNLVLLVC